MSDAAKRNDDHFSRWAGLFVEAYERQTRQTYCGLTPAAVQLLQAVDKGGVPAFISPAMVTVAQENGVAVAGDWTPNQVIEALRSKVSAVCEK
jgi:hypothetical protein